MSDETDAFLRRVFEKLPQLREVYNTILADCLAQGMADVAPMELLTRHLDDLIDKVVAGEDSAWSDLGSYLGLLEREFGQSDEVDQVIDIAVLPTLTSFGNGPDLTGLLGPKLTRIVNREREWRARPSDVALAARLLDAVPALRPLTEGNTYGDHRDILIHSFLADVVRREIENLQLGRFEEVSSVLAVLENELTDDPEDAVATGFVENLPHPGEPGAEIVDLLGPRLRAEFQSQRSPNQS